MDTLKRRAENRWLFLRRDAKLDERIRTDYIDNGIATLPCRVTGMEDIISHYSVPGYETLSSEFADYVESTAGFIPAGYPIVLEISGCRFTEQEQAVIRRTVRDDFTYDLGAVQKANRRKLLVALAMLIGMIATGLLTFGTSFMGDSAVEVAYIFFWFFADMTVCYFLLDSFGDRRERLLAGRLADMELYFSEDYDDSAVTDEDARLVYEALEKSAKE